MDWDAMLRLTDGKTVDGITFPAGAVVMVKYTDEIDPDDVIAVKTSDGVTLAKPTEWATIWRGVTPIGRVVGYVAKL